MYDKPYYLPLIKEYSSPSPHQVALALARKYNWRICVGGNAALNVLGLSAQVPATWKYASSGPYKKYTMGNCTLEFRHRSATQMSGKSQKTLLVIQAIKALGPGKCEHSDIRILQRALSPQEKADLSREASTAPLWMRALLRKICEG